jgi:methionyl-tRNA formyltransferase
MKIAFLGSGDIGIPVLRWLMVAPGVELAGVVTQPDRPAGRGLQLTPCATKELALGHGILPRQPARVRAPEAVEEIAAWQPDLLVVMAYGQILPQELLDVPKLGALNLHASILPRHRGAAPVHAAILAGDATSGITVMWMDAGLDTGDILLVKECPLAEEETAGTLHDKLAGLAPVALAEALQSIRAGRAPRLKQDEAQATYAPKLTRALGRIDWTKSAAEIARTVRGLHPWPGCTAQLEVEGGGRLDIKIHRAAVTDQSPDAAQLRLPCAGGGVLELREVQPAGGKRMSAGEFIRGHRIRRAVEPGS